jgi:uncharacterized membrane protein
MSKNDAMWACLVMIVLLIVYGIVGDADYHEQQALEQAKAQAIEISKQRWQL